MSFEQLVAMRPEIDALADTDCVLFLWSINSMPEQALQLIRAWGFTFKTTAFTWVKKTKHGKRHIGLGFWTRQNTERVLLATRGKPQRLNADVSELLITTVRQHSEKPDETYALIERLVPGPYCELFARKTRPGWATAFSPEAGLLDHGAVNTRRQPSDLTRKANVMGATAQRIEEENAQRREDEEARRLKAEDSHWARLVELIEEDPDLAAKFEPLDGLSIGELFENSFGRFTPEQAIELLRRSLA